MKYQGIHKIHEGRFIIRYDMAIGLRNSLDQKRPDDVAKKELGKKAFTVFPIPSRDAI